MPSVLRAANANLVCRPAGPVSLTTLPFFHLRSHLLQETVLLGANVSEPIFDETADLPPMNERVRF